MVVRKRAREIVCFCAAVDGPHLAGATDDENRKERGSVCLLLGKERLKRKERLTG